jgi:glycine/D-amino acid oxidase-like deaminating enzyme
VVVKTSKDSYAADKLVISPGSWMGEVVPDLNLPLTCERQVVFWLKPVEQAGRFESTVMPVFGWFGRDLRGYYGIPDLGSGVKVAQDHFGRATAPDFVDRHVTVEDERPVRNFVRDHIPLLDGEVLSSVTCLYTNTPDGHFLLDFHPRHRNVLLVSPCSGHGFKFSSVIGEVASDLIDRGYTPHDISRFKVNRLLPH